MFWLPGPKKEKPKGAARQSAGPRPPRAVFARGPAPESDWEAPSEFPRLSGVVGLDVETRDDQMRRRGAGWCFRDNPTDQIVGIGVAWGVDGKGYWPVAHAGGGNVDPGPVWAWLRDCARDPGVQFVCHNKYYDAGWLGRHGVVCHTPAHDTMLAAALLDEHRRVQRAAKGFKGYNLESVGLDYLGQGKNEDLLIAAGLHLGFKPGDDTKANLWQFPAKYVGPYGEDDPRRTLDLWYTLEPLLRKQGLWRVYQLEVQVSEVLLAMRTLGVRVDMDGAEQLLNRLKGESRATQQALDTLAGFPININSDKDLERLFKARGVIVPRTDKGNVSVTKEWLKSIRNREPAAKLIGQRRREQKMQGTYVEGYVLKMASHGRIHGSFNQLASDEGGTISGRFSSSDPNMQNWPSPDKDPDMAKLIRSLLLPEEGQLWMSGDYSAQEPRLAVHFACAIGATGAEAMAAEFHANPKFDMHQWVAELMSIDRPPGKVMNLAKMYGRGSASVARELGLPTEWVSRLKRDKNGHEYDDAYEVAGPEAAALIAAYDAKFPFMQETSNTAKRYATTRGYVRTLLGRRCRFGEYAKPFTAFNKLIQGSAADQGKVALVETYKSGYGLPHVVVHDEGGNSVESVEHARRIREIMEQCVPLRVPSRVDMAIGSSWGGAVECE